MLACERRHLRLSRFAPPIRYSVCSYQESNVSHNLKSCVTRHFPNANFWVNNLSKQTWNEYCTTSCNRKKSSKRWKTTRLEGIFKCHARISGSFRRNLPFDPWWFCCLPQVPVDSNVIMEIRSSPNYIWNIKDILGQGATGAVYKGRHKVTWFLKLIFMMMILSLISETSYAVYNCIVCCSEVWRTGNLRHIK